MEINKKFISISFISISIISLFAPFLYTNQVYFSLFSSLNSLLFIPFILILLSCIFLIFDKSWSYLLSSIFSIFSLVLILCTRSILSIPDSSSFGPGFYFLTLFSFIVFAYSYINFNSSNLFNIKDIVELGILISLAIVFDQSFLKIRVGQNGGSISLVMLPLFLISYRKGFVKSFIGCGLVFGLITCFLDGYGFYTFPFDYLLGFGSIAIAGLFRKLIINKTYKFKISGLIFLIVSFVISIVFRIASSTISGMVFYGLTFVPSLVYQLAYIIPSSIAVLALLVILYKPLLMVEKTFR